MHAVGEVVLLWPCSALQVPEGLQFCYPQESDAQLCPASDCARCVVKELGWCIA